MQRTIGGLEPTERERDFVVKGLAYNGTLCITVWNIPKKKTLISNCKEAK